MVSSASIETFTRKYNIEDYGVLDPVYEVTRILKKTEEKDLIPAFNVKGTSTTSVGNLVSTRKRLLEALGVENEEEAYKKILNAVENPKELTWVGDPGGYRSVDEGFKSLPFAKFFEKDGGLYLTAAFIIACWKGVCNASIHRMMYIDERRVAVRIVPRHLYKLYNDAVKEEGRLPVTVVLGVHPAVLVAVSTSPSLGQFELGVASRLLNGLEVFPSPVHGNPVPVGTGAIVEGYLTAERVEEGPFTDILMLYDKVRREPVLYAEKVFVSDNYTHVILPGGREHMHLMGFPREAQIWASVSRVVPRVYKVRLSPGGGGWLHAIISIEKNHDGDAKNAIMAAFAGHPSLKHVVVVDGDIDPDNYEMVEWAIATRFQADRDLVVIKNARGSTLDPSADNGFTAKMGIDATVPRKGDPHFERAKWPG
ncbi:MAG: UbiD family decarboxylase [Crenarchaeota archaeon]|nr:UbiD family decarboxylase [Thermoproteota archaeon]